MPALAARTCGSPASPVDVLIKCSRFDNPSAHQKTLSLLFVIVAPCSLRQRYPSEMPMHLNSGYPNSGPSSGLWKCNVVLPPCPKRFLDITALINTVRRRQDPPEHSIGMESSSRASGVRWRDAGAARVAASSWVEWPAIAWLTPCHCCSPLWVTTGSP